MARYDEAVGVQAKLYPGAEHDAAEAEVMRWTATLKELEAQVPNPPRSYADLVLLAEIGRHGANLGRDGRMAELDANDVFARPAARLIEAVLHFTGSDIGKALAPPSSATGPAVLPPLSPEHRKYQKIVAEIARFEGSDYPPGMSAEESEAALDALSDEATSLEREAWATPAKTLADVLLRGEVALHNENGVMESLDDAEAYYDERAVAQLIRAVVDVLGGRHAR